MKTRILIASAGLAVSTFAYAPAPIVFDTPAADEKGMMVLGNGEVGAMAWLDAAGTLHTVLQNSDSWNEQLERGRPPREDRRDRLRDEVARR